MSTEATIADALTAGVTALREGRPTDAVPRLVEALEGLEGNEDLEDFTARAASLLAQARLAIGDLAGARQAAHQAMRILRRHQDQAGLDEVRSLDEQIGAALEAQKRALVARAKAESAAAQTADALEAMATTPYARADALLQHTDALRRVEEPERAVHSATRAAFWADAAGAVRERVLARLALAELGQDPELQLAEAGAIADAANETTLVGLVAKACELLGIALKPLPFAGKDVGA